MVVSNGLFRRIRNGLNLGDIIIRRFGFILCRLVFDIVVRFLTDDLYGQCAAFIGFVFLGLAGYDKFNGFLNQ